MFNLTIMQIFVICSVTCSKVDISTAVSFYIFYNKKRKIKDKGHGIHVMNIMSPFPYTCSMISKVKLAQ